MTWIIETQPDRMRGVYQPGDDPPQTWSAGPYGATGLSVPERHQQLAAGRALEQVADDLDATAADVGAEGFEAA